MATNQQVKWRIDVHHHVVPPEYVDDSMPIKPPDTQRQLESMDSWRIQAAVTSLTPRVMLKNRHRLRTVARVCNEFQARIVLDYPARFGSFALLPLPDVNGALEEIAYAFDILHLDGAGLFSSVTDRYLGDPLFDPVFDELDRLARSPRTELEGIKNILASIDSGHKNPADFVDMSILDEIEREGFVRKLYGQ